MSKSVVINGSQIGFDPEDMLARKPIEPGSAEEAKDLELERSIGQYGLMNSFTVRSLGVDENGVEKFAPVDGNRRGRILQKMYEEGTYTEMFTVRVEEYDDVQALAASITGNATVQPMKTAEYAKALKKLLVHRVYESISDLAVAVGMGVTQVEKYLDINNLPENVKELLNEGKLTVGKAHDLTKLPVEYLEDNDTLADFLEKAMVQNGAEFSATVEESKKAYNKEKRGQREEKGFEPKAKLKSKDELLSLYASAEAEYQSTGSEVDKAYLEGIAICISLDEQSVAEQKETYDKEQKRKEDLAKNRAKAREEKKAAEIAADLAAKGYKVTDAEGNEVEPNEEDKS